MLWLISTAGRIPNLWLHSIITVRNEVAKVMFVCLSTGGGVCLTACWDTNPAPPTRQVPPRTTHTPGRHPQEAHPLEANLLGKTLPREAPPPETADAADGTHPTGMHSCVEYVSTGRTWTLIRIQLLFPNGYCTHLRHGSLFQTNT